MYVLCGIDKRNHCECLLYSYMYLTTGTQTRLKDDTCYYTFESGKADSFRNAVLLLLVGKSVRPLPAFFTQTHRFYLPLIRKHVAACVCFYRFIWSGRGMWSLKSCVYVCVCDVCWELKRKHEVKLCLLSSWDRIIDPPSGLTLVINRALHQEDMWVKKAQSESLFFPRSVTYMFSHWRSHPKQVTLNIQSLKMENIRVTDAY